MEFLIILAFITLGGLGVVVWMRASDDWHERDEWRRFQEAMRAAEDDDRYLDADDRRPE